MSDAVEVVAAPAAAAKPPKKRRKKKSKAPPYQTYQVVTLANQEGTPPAVLRPVNAFDVLLIDQYPNGGFEYRKAPGNIKFRKLVDLSQSNFDSMTAKRISTADEKDHQARQELAMSVSETIRIDWGGLFLKRIRPEDVNCTQWVDIGVPASVLEVSARFQSSLTDKDKKIKVKTEVKLERDRNQQQQQQNQQQQAVKQQVLPEAPVQQQVPPAVAPTPQAAIGIIPSQGPLATTATNHVAAAPTPLHHWPPATPMTLRLGPNGSPQLPPLPGSFQISPGLAFFQNIQLPATPAMPPLTAHAQQPFSPQAPGNRSTLPPLQGMVTNTVAANPQKPALKPPPPPPPPVAAQEPEPAPIPKRKRGRPRKGEERPPKPPKPKRPRGRPRKTEGPRPQHVIKKKVRLPPMRVTKAVVPLPSSPDLLRGNGVLALPPPANGNNVALVPSPAKIVANRTFEFQLDVDAGLGVANASSPGLVPLPPLDAPVHHETGVPPPNPQPQPLVRTPINAKRPQSNITLISPPPFSPFPIPPPPPEAQLVNPTIEQAKTYLKMKDPEWMTCYVMLSYCRINHYINGYMHKWTAGQCRHMIRRGDQCFDTNLLEWVVDQQTMYKEYCSWEEAQYQKQFGPPPAATKKPEAQRTSAAAASTSKDGKQKAQSTTTAEAPPQAVTVANTRPKRTKKIAAKRKVVPSDATKAKPKKKQKKQPTSTAKKVAAKGTTKEPANDDSKEPVKKGVAKTDSNQAAKKNDTTDDSSESQRKQQKQAAEPDLDERKENNGVAPGQPNGHMDGSASIKRSPLKESQVSTNAPEAAGPKHKKGAEEAASNEADIGSKTHVSIVPVPKPSLGQSDVDRHDAATSKAEGTAAKTDAVSEAKRLAEERKMKKLRQVQRAKILLLDDLRFVWQPDREPPADAPDEWKEMFYELRDYVRTRGDTAVSDGVELGVWTQLQRKIFQRSLEMMSKQQQKVSTGTRSTTAHPSTQSPEPPLSRGQMAALRALGFDWDDLESSQFYAMYLKLLEFKNRVGDCLVPPPENEGLEFEQEEEEEGEGVDFILETRVDPKLFYWVQRQRYEYERMLKIKEIEEQRAAGVDEAGHELVQELLKQDRREALEAGTLAHAAGAEDNDDGTVVCDLVRSPTPKWNGNTARASFSRGANPVSAKDNGDKDAAAAKKVERRGRKKKQKIASSEHISTLTKTHIEALNGAGFIWSTDITAAWVTQYRRLHAFYVQYGHSQVTKATNQMWTVTRLNRWCTQVRQQYQKRKNGEKGGLSQAKLDLLKRLDFIFEFEDMAERYTWHERLVWLKEFKEEHGHVMVPQKHPTLGNFVKRLRKEYEVEVKGIKMMNPEKRIALDKIGFQWRVRGHRGRRRADQPKRYKAYEDDEDSDDEKDEEDEEEEYNAEKSQQEQAAAPAKVAALHVHAQKKDSPDLSNQCAGCFSTILFPSATCRWCRKGYCQDCYDEILHCNEQNCSSCRGPVAATSGFG